MKKVGRPKIKSMLGDKHRHSLECYDLEWQQIRIYFEKLKSQRPKYYIEEGED